MKRRALDTHMHMNHKHYLFVIASSGGRASFYIYLLGELHHQPDGVTVVGATEEVVMVELVVQLVEIGALAEALVLGDQRAVALPKGGWQRGTPAHTPLGLVMPIINSRVEDARHARDRRDVAAPEVAVQDARLQQTSKLLETL